MHNLNLDQTFIAQVLQIARSAGAAIMAIYQNPAAATVEIKADGSPVTRADLAAQRIIVEALHQLLPIPIISEEAAWPAAAERHSWRQYWLVDPLDGTKEFIARNGQFTVNIALIENGTPLLGVVHLPVGDESYVGLQHPGQTRAEKYLAGEKIADLHCASVEQRLAAAQPLRVLVSHRHAGEETRNLLQQLQQRWPAPLEYVKVGSSLKFCWLAEGRGDFYPRLGPTSEWDTAAGQAVLTAAGGRVLNAQDLTPLTYNGSDSLLNPWFFALADTQLLGLLNCPDPAGDIEAHQPLGSVGRHTDG